MFTEEEVKTAKATRDEIIRNDIEVLKGIYMAGEICMWDEMRSTQPQPSLTEQPLPTPPTTEIKDIP